ncbi:MAG: RelA/SpoT family protein [Candidatus Gracilibacteria bacterium]|nr:RelA/SpoT family protein [Candidatus Gracilibacteria bacterium]
MSEKIENIADYTEADSVAHELIELVSEYMNIDKQIIHDRIWNTYMFAKEAHHGQVRKSGEPYIIHPLLAAKLLLHLKPDLVTIQSCILHDVIEDTDRTKADIAKEFGDEVALICEGLSKLSAIKYRGEERSIESLRKMFIAMVEDLRVIIVKLADRLHNMQTLQHHADPQKRERIALETLNIYAPIADRLGIFHMKEMLETECFHVLHPKEFAEITRELAELQEEQEYFLSKAKTIIREMIPESVPIRDISYRIKAPYSIYKKIFRKEYSYTHARDLYDLFAIRIITDTIPRCYEILGVLHNVFVPMPKRFKDYIALPKENGYQSLHTTVVGLFPEVRSQPTEIQIRTPEMHIQAEIGVAAHFEYSEKGTSAKSQDSYWVKTIKGIVENVIEGKEFMSEMSVNVFSDQIFVFTPKGDIITLPKGSTPVDFAYAIHSKFGNELTIAKVNGQVVPLDYTLRNGESVQIVTDVHRKPNPIWLSFVKTAKAKEHIRQFMNREERGFFLEKGRFILNSYLEKNYGKGLDKELSLLKNMDGHILDTKQKEDVLVQIGNLSRKPSSVLKAIHDDVILEMLGTEKKIETKDEPIPKEKKSRIHNSSDEEITVLIGQERDIPYKFAQCCNPVPPDKIMGYIGMGEITIHRFDCPNIEKIQPDRRMPAQWSNAQTDGVTLEVECIFHDKMGLLRQVTDILYQAGVNIESLTTSKLPNGDVSDRFILHSDEEDYYLYDRLVDRFRFAIPEFIEMRLISMG